MIKKVTYTTTMNERFCDFCDDKAENKCSVCGKDLCKKHSSLIWIDNNDDWDSKYYFCKDCYKLFKNHNENIEKAEDKVYEAKDEIEAIIKNFFDTLRKNKKVK